MVILQNGADEITWQTYKGQLTERQEKTRSKIIKRMEKVSCLVCFASNTLIYLILVLKIIM